MRQNDPLWDTLATPTPIPPPPRHHLPAGQQACQPCKVPVAASKCCSLPGRPDQPEPAGLTSSGLGQRPQERHLASTSNSDLMLARKMDQSLYYYFLLASAIIMNFGLRYYFWRLPPLLFQFLASAIIMILCLR